MANSYEGAVNKAKEAVTTISGLVDKLDQKLKSVVKTLTDYQKVEMPSKVTAQLKAQADAMKKLEGTVVDLKQKLEEKAQAETKLASVTRMHTEESMKATLANQKHNAELKKSIQGTTQTADAFQQLTQRQKEQTAQLNALDAQGKRGTQEYKNLASAIKLNGEVINDIKQATKELTSTEKEGIETLKGKIPTLKELVILGKEQTMAMNNITNAYQQLQSQEKTQLQLIQNLTAELKKLDDEGKQETEIYRQKTQSLKTISEQYTQTKDKIKEVDESIKKLTASEKEKATATQKVVTAYGDLNQRLQQAKEAYMAVIVAGRGVNESTRDYNKRLMDAKIHFQNLTNQANAAKKAVSNFGNTSLGGLVQSARSLMSAFGVIGGVTLFASLVKDAFNLTRTLDSIGFSMKAVIKDSAELAGTQIWLKKITEDFGAELVTTTNRYIKFRAAATQANFTAEETQNIFATMTKAAGVLGLKTDELQGIYLALEQMISKGKITTEELRRQLGERLPGAMDIMAKSMGVTTAELDKMLKAGEVITKDVLPGFAKQVEIAFGIQNVDRVDTLQAATVRLKNAWTNLVKDFNDGNNASSSLMNIIDGLANNLTSMLSVLLTVGKYFLIWKASIILTNIAIAANSKLLALQRLAAINSAKGISVATTSFKAFNTVLKANALFLAISAITLFISWMNKIPISASDAAKGINEVNTEASKTSEAMAKTHNETKKLVERYEELTAEAKKLGGETKLSNEKQVELKDTIVAIGKAIPDAVTAFDQYRNALGLSSEAAKQFLKDNEELILGQADINIRKSTAALTEQEEQIRKIGMLESGSMVQNIFGWKTLKKNAKGYYEATAAGGDAMIKLQGQAKLNILTEIALIKEQTRQAKITKETNEDIKSSITGQYNARQLEAMAAQKIIDDENKAEQDRLGNMTVKETKQKAIDDAEIKRNEALGLNAEEMSKLKIANEDAYVAKVKQAIDDVINYNKEAYETAKTNLKTAQDDYDEFFDKKGDKKGQNIENQLEREEEKRLKARIKAEKAALKAKEEAVQTELDINLTMNEAIIDDDLKSKKERLDNLYAFVVDSKKSLDSNRLYEIGVAELTLEEIEKSNIRSDEEKVTAKEAHTDTLLAIENKYNDDVNKLRLQNTDYFENILLSEADRIKLQNQNKLSAMQEGFDEKERIEQANFDLEKAWLDKSLDDNLITQEDYNKTLEYLNLKREQNIQRIQRESNIVQLKEAIDFALDEASLIVDKDKREAEMKRIAQIQMDLDRKIHENKAINAAESITELQRIEDLKLEILTTSADLISEAFDLNADDVLSLFHKVRGTIEGTGDGIKKTMEDIVATIQLASGIAGDVLDNLSERRIEKIDEEIAKNTEYYDKILENELLSEEQREALEAQRDAKNLLLENKKKKEQEKQARTAKIFAAFNIALTTAMAVVGALAPPPTGLGIPAGIPFSILVGAMGAASIAATLARPIPKFERGTKNAPGGWAMVDERVPEVHTDANDNIKSRGYNKPNLRYLSKGDKIYKSKEEFLNKMAIQDINRTAWELNMESNGKAITQVQVDEALIQQITGLRGDMDTMGRRIEKIASRPINNKVTVEIEDKRPY